MNAVYEESSNGIMASSYIITILWKQTETFDKRNKVDQLVSKQYDLQLRCHVIYDPSKKIHDQDNLLANRFTDPDRMNGR